MNFLFTQMLNSFNYSLFLGTVKNIFPHMCNSNIISELCTVHMSIKSSRIYKPVSLPPYLREIWELKEVTFTLEFNIAVWIPFTHDYLFGLWLYHTLYIRVPAQIKSSILSMNIVEYYFLSPGLHLSNFYLFLGYYPVPHLIKNTS